MCRAPTGWPACGTSSSSQFHDNPTHIIVLRLNSCRAFTEVPGLLDGHLEHRLTDKFTKIDETRFTASTIGAIIVGVEPQITFQQSHSFYLL